MKMSSIRFIVIAGLLFFLATCKKDAIISKGHLEFSTDTVLFDTVFTTVGSTTKKFKIYNPNNTKLVIDEIELMGGANSPFRINIDGVSGILHKEIELGKNDSLFAFVEVTLEVNSSNYPMIISDSIRFRTNGLDQFIQLIVWGQDAYFHANEITSGVWLNDKPHVLYGIVAVGYPGIDSNLSLTIPQGTNIYCHKNSTLLVYKSSLDIQGQLNNEVTFQGDRLESFYDDVSGQWGGIRLIESQLSSINYALILNASVGIQVDSTEAPLTLNLSNTKVENSAFFNLFLNSGPTVTIENCLFGDAGLVSVYLFAGGEYHFRNCSFANYWNGSRGGPAFAMKNWWTYDGEIYCRNIINSEFNNCVGYGNSDDEFLVDTLDCGGTTIDFTVQSSVFKGSEPYMYSNYLNVIWNQDPLFIDPANSNFHLGSGSSCIGVGNAIFATPLDIEGVAWGGTIEAGCYNY